MMDRRREDLRPVIGVTPDIADGRWRVSPTYAERVAEAGGVPVVLAPRVELIGPYFELCSGFILTGGDDPNMGQWGQETHPKATPIDPMRQRFETALLAALDQFVDVPVLGICLGMQLMGLHCGGTLDQHLPDSLSTASEHFGHKAHAVFGEIGSGKVHSHHRQALSSAGTLRIVGRSHDGVIEAVRDPSREFYLGVQWHPERTSDAVFGRDLIVSLVEAARQHPANR